MKKIISILLCGLMIFCLSGCGNSDLEDAKSDLQETYEKYGWVEKETVDTLVAKFNTEVVDNSALNPASSDYLTENNNQYWYGLVEGIYLVVSPEEFTGDKKTEIVDNMILYVDRNSQYESDAIEYAKHLLRSNNSEITNDEIDTLLKDAKEKAESKQTANNGKGISVGYVEEDDTYQYQIIRLYK